MKIDRATEKKTADVLLKRGVKVLIKAPFFYRLFGKKQMTITVKAPTLHTLIRIAGESLLMDVNLTEQICLKDAITIVAEHGKRMSVIVALAVVNSPVKGWRLRLMARHLRNNIDVKQLFYLYQLILIYGGYADFIDTIKFTEETRITKPMNLSQKEKRN